MFSISFSRKIWLKSVLLFWGILFSLAVLSIYLLHYGLSRISSIVVFILYCIIFGMGYAFYPLSRNITKSADQIADKLTEDARRAKRGFMGEDTVSSWLTELLDKNNFTIRRNLYLPGHKFDIDFVITGPKGIIVLEAKNLSDYVAFIENTYLTTSGDGKLHPSNYEDPRNETLRHAEALKKYLISCGISGMQISKAVVFLNSRLVSIKGPMGVYIALGREGLERFLDGVRTDPVSTPKFCQNIERALRNLH